MGIMINHYKQFVNNESQNMSNAQEVPKLGTSAYSLHHMGWQTNYKDYIK